MNKCKNCGKQLLAVNGEWVHRAPFPNCNNAELEGNLQETHEGFVNEVLEKTKPLSVPEESEECMKEDYEHDPKVRGPRSRPEYKRRKNNSQHEVKPETDGEGAGSAGQSPSFDSLTDKAHVDTNNDIPTSQPIKTEQVGSDDLPVRGRETEEMVAFEPGDTINMETGELIKFDANCEENVGGSE